MSSPGYRAAVACTWRRGPTLTRMATADVDLDGQRHRIDWPPHATLVDVMEAAGIDVPNSCREGRCGSCVCTVVSGDVDTAPNDVLEPEDLRSGLILACQSRPISDEVHIEF